MTSGKDVPGAESLATSRWVRWESLAVVVLVLVAVAGRVVQQRDSSGVYPDTYRYVKMAEAIAAGDLSSYHSQFGATGAVMYPIGYPLLIAAARPLTGSFLAAARLWPLLLGTLLAALVYVLARQLGADWRGALLAGVLCAADPLTAWMGATATTEGLLGTFIAASFLGLGIYLKHDSRAALIAASAFGCLGVLTRSEGIAVLLAAGALLYTLLRQSGRGDRAARTTVLFLAPIVVALVADMTAEQVWLSRIGGSTRLTSMVRLALVETGLYPEHWRLAADGTTLQWVQDSPRLLRDWWLAHPAAAARSTIESALHGLKAFFLVGGNPWVDTSEVGRSLLRGGHRIVLALAALLALWVWRRRRLGELPAALRLAGGSAALAVVAVTVGLALFSQRPYQMERMLAPLLPAALAVCGALLSVLPSLAQRPMTRRQRRREPRLRQPGVRRVATAVMVVAATTCAVGYGRDTFHSIGRLRRGTSIGQVRAAVARQLRIDAPPRSRLMVDSQFLYPVILSGHEAIFTPASYGAGIDRYLRLGGVRFALVSQMRHAGEPSRLERLTATLTSLGRSYHVLATPFYERSVPDMSGRPIPYMYRLVALD